MKKFRDIKSIFADKAPNYTRKNTYDDAVLSVSQFRVLKWYVKHVKFLD